ncbi:cell division protein FtsZ, partial [Burkholderia pseudomallei]
MDELTLGLIGAGAVVVGGVVVYNAWQGAKVRRRMPRPMPSEAEAAARHEREDDAPFIEPVRPSKLYAGTPSTSRSAFSMNSNG